MKKLLLIFSVLLISSSVLGQIMSGSTTEYFTVNSNTYILEQTQFVMYITNHNNNKQDSLFYYKDGRRADGTWDDYAMAEMNKDGINRAIDETFTASEIESLKSSQTAITITYVFNDKGLVLECSFIIPRRPAALALPKERFATLEQKIKQYVTTTITDENTKKLKYVYGATRISLWNR